jgi:hypothetical protein
MDRLIANIRIHERLDSYSSFFDHDWVQRITALVAGTKMESPVDTLGMHWKAAANAHRLPWLMIELLKSFAGGLMRSSSPPADRLAELMKRRLVADMGNALTKKQRTRLSQLVNNLAQIARESSETANRTWTTRAPWAQLWLELVKDGEFAISLWGSQRLCYGAVYFAYENFARDALSAATGRTVRGDFDSGGKFLADLKKTFGNQLIVECVADREVNIARLVRNALVHHVGKLTDELRGLPHGLTVEDDVIQIMAPDTCRLFNALKDRAFKLAQCAVGLPNMRKTGASP